MQKCAAIYPHREANVQRHAVIVRQLFLHGFYDDLGGWCGGRLNPCDYLSRPCGDVPNP